MPFESTSPTNLLLDTCLLSSFITMSQSTNDYKYILPKSGDTTKDEERDRIRRSMAPGPSLSPTLAAVPDNRTTNDTTQTPSSRPPRQQDYEFVFHQFPASHRMTQATRETQQSNQPGGTTSSATSNQQSTSQAVTTNPLKRRGRPSKAERDRLLNMAGARDSSTSTGNNNPFSPGPSVQALRTSPSLSRPLSVQPPQAQGQPAQQDPSNQFYVPCHYRTEHPDRRLLGTGIINIAPDPSGNVPYPSLVAFLNSQAHDTTRDVCSPFSCTYPIQEQ